jgi:hypothetical protein
MLKAALFSLAVACSGYANAGTMADECKSTAKGSKIFAQWRDSGVPIEQALDRVRGAFSNDDPDVRAAWIGQLDNVYEGKMKGFNPQQTEMIMYNACMGRMTMP